MRSPTKNLNMIFLPDRRSSVGAPRQPVLYTSGTVLKMRLKALPPGPAGVASWTPLGRYFTTRERAGDAARGEIDVSNDRTVRRGSVLICERIGLGEETS